MVVPHGIKCLGQLCAFFLDFDRVSGLRLNIAKTVIVPLFPHDGSEVRALLSSEAPDWGGVTIAEAAKYLGFYVGPGRLQHSWTAPLAKFLDRAKSWGEMGLGTLTTFQAYQVFISSVLLFVAQLDPLPENFDNHERKACRSLFPGPTRWMTPGCLKEFKSFNFPRELPDVQALATAAKARIVRFECVSSGGLNIEQRAHALDALSFNDQCSLAQFSWVSEWRKHSFLIHLRDADQALKVQLANGRGHELKLNLRLGWQGRISTLFHGQTRFTAQLHLRRKLDRWVLQTLPGRRLPRVERTLDAISSLVNPRVLSSYIRLLCNGWMTNRRFQGRGFCSFRCGVQEDSIEHFSKCRMVKSYFRRSLDLHPPDQGWELDHFLCMDVRCDLMRSNSGDEDPFSRICRRRALGCYALYMLHNSIRHGSVDADDFPDAFDRFVKNGELGIDQCGGLSV